jgi:glycosyltransferase involved in cell wall biosynthesis
LLYAVDFPPADRGGGGSLILRLLEGYPADSLFVATSARHAKALAEGPLAVSDKLLFPELTGKKRCGVGHLWMLLDRLLIPLLALAMLRMIRRSKTGVILSIAHGYYFLAAALAARMAGLPFVLIVHDDWVAMSRQVRVFRVFAPALFRWALVQAAQIFAVCPEMQAHLKRRYGVDSDVQYPAAPANPADGSLAGVRQPLNPADAAPAGVRQPLNPTDALEGVRRPLRVMFTGCVYGNVRSTLDVLVRALRNAPGMELRLCTQLSAEEFESLGWNQPAIRHYGWLPAEEFRGELRAADVLFLPLSFEPAEANYSATSFPSKLAYYLAAGRPILTVGPAQASAVRHARAHAYAEVVTECSEAAILGALERLRSDAQRSGQLASNALRAFDRHHRIEGQRVKFWECLACL